jgi:hypothetical protein
VEAEARRDEGLRDDAEVLRDEAVALRGDAVALRGDAERDAAAVLRRGLEAADFFADDAAGLRVEDVDDLRVVAPLREERPELDLGWGMGFLPLIRVYVREATARRSGDQQLEQRLLCVTPVLGLIPDALALAVEDLGGDLLTRMCR